MTILRHGRRPMTLAFSLSCLAVAIVACSGEDAGKADAAQTAAPQSQKADLVNSKTLAPTALTAWEKHARAMCREVGEKYVGARFAPLRNADASAEVGGTNGGFLVGDFNGDGQTDYVAVTASGGCASEGPAYGQAGPPNDFILSAPGGYIVQDGFSAFIGPAMVKRRGDRDVLEFDGGFNGECGLVKTVVWGVTNGKVDAIERRNERGEIVDHEGCRLSTRTASPLNAFPPIPKGFYAAGKNCAAAIAERAESDRSYPGDNLGIFDEENWGFFFEDTMPWGNKTYTGFEMIGPNRYRIKLLTFGNGDGPGLAETATIAIVGPGKFTETYLGHSTTYTHCPANSVPASLRKHFESDQ